MTNTQLNGITVSSGMRPGHAKLTDLRAYGDARLAIYSFCLKLARITYMYNCCLYISGETMGNLIECVYKKYRFKSC